MKKEFVVSRIEASQDGSPYIYVGFNDPKSGSTARTQQPQSPFGIGTMTFNSPEDLMKNLPKAMSNLMGGAGLGGGAMSGDSPTFKMTMREYEDIGIKVGDKVTIEVNKADNSGI